MGGHVLESCGGSITEMQSSQLRAGCRHGRIFRHRDKIPRKTRDPIKNISCPPSYCCTCLRSPDLVGATITGDRHRYRTPLKMKKHDRARIKEHHRIWLWVLFWLIAIVGIVGMYATMGWRWNSTPHYDY